jgi:hypothetical protein
LGTEKFVERHKKDAESVHSSDMEKAPWKERKVTKVWGSNDGVGLGTANEHGAVLSLMKLCNDGVGASMSRDSTGV